MVENKELIKLDRFGMRICSIDLPSISFRTGICPKGRERELEKEMGQGMERSTFLRIPLSSGQTIVTTTEGFDIFTEQFPFKTGNPSDAVYMLRHVSENIIVLAQRLKPLGRTSHHTHPNAAETYFPLTNDFFILHNGEPVHVTNKTTVYPNESHMCFAFGSESYGVLVTEGESFEHKLIGGKPEIDELFHRIYDHAFGLPREPRILYQASLPQQVWQPERG